MGGGLLWIVGLIVGPTLALPVLCVVALALAVWSL
jgi:hypothetical protein